MCKSVTMCSSCLDDFFFVYCNGLLDNKQVRFKQVYLKPISLVSTIIYGEKLCNKCHDWHHWQSLQQTTNSVVMRAQLVFAREHQNWCSGPWVTPGT